MSSLFFVDLICVIDHCWLSDSLSLLLWESRQSNDDHYDDNDDDVTDDNNDNAVTQVGAVWTLHQHV